MVNTSKILTVSYGTFSCTLEGFDDSFETMKAIAEYFRDLAADDRYFGAEPPVPDAEMLARIAEREIARRVEAREEKGGIVLRAARPDEKYSLTAPTPAAKAAPVADPAPVARTEPVPPSRPEPQPKPAEDLQDPWQAPADAVADAPAASDSQDIAAALPDAPTIDQPEQALSGHVSAEDVVTEDVIAEEVAARDMPVRRAASEDSTIAAKLQRIRAVVSRNTAVASDYSEDEHADVFDGHGTTTLDTVLTESEDAAPSSDLAEDDDLVPTDVIVETGIEQTPDPDARPEEDHEPAEADTEALAPVQPTTDDADDTAQETLVPDTVAETRIDATEPRTSTVEDAENEDDVASILDRLAGLSDDQERDDIAAEASADAPQGRDGNDTLDDFLASLDGTDDVTADVPEQTGQPHPTGEHAPAQDMPVSEQPSQPPLRARVVKMKRADFEAAIAEGHLEETDEDDGFADDWHALDDAALSPEEEAELQAELAEVEAELEDEDSLASDDDAEEVDSIFAEGLDDTPYPADRRRALDQLDEAASERDMTRLMAKTISEMDEPESTSRRNAIAHLRAAVAATRADKEAGVTERPDTIGDAFRDDLASVVRPRRPRAEGTATARPVEQTRAAPLKLVAEQRIDAPATPPAPVRPRRVSMSEIQQDQRQNTATTEPGSSFAAYVEEKGAHELPEILEAAASFLSFVEGRDQFSRPQLMTRARSVVGDEFSREDGLRSFGQLLRQGKIQKLKGGRFTVSEQIGFQPTERRAG